MDNLYIVIPAYNEEENIEKVVEDWYQVIKSHNGGQNSRLIVIDDGSKDNTYAILQKIAETSPLLVPLHKKNGGHGDTLLFGYHYAIRHGADYIFQTDSDGQTNPNEFEEFWSKRKDFNAIFGNRKRRGDGTGRYLIEKILCLILWLQFGIVVPDSNAPFRLMKASYVKKYMEFLPEHYNLPNVMLVALGIYFQDNIKFMEITFQSRQGGKNSINFSKIIKIGSKALIDFARIRTEAKKDKRRQGI